MTTKTPTATGRTTADQPTTQARPQGTHIGMTAPSQPSADHPDLRARPTVRHVHLAAQSGGSARRLRRARALAWSRSGHWPPRSRYPATGSWRLPRS